jgi:hypothetical protein
LVALATPLEVSTVSENEILMDVVSTLQSLTRSVAIVDLLPPRSLVSSICNPFLALIAW